MIYMYYVFIEAWCLGYAWNYLTGAHADSASDPASTQTFFGSFVGHARQTVRVVHRSATGRSGRLIFLVICFVLNFFLIYRGLNKGIEWFCKFAMPALSSAR